MQFVGRFAFVVDKVLAFVRRTLEVEHELFDKWFDRCLFELAPELEPFVAWLGIEPLEANYPVVLEHFGLFHELENKTNLFRGNSFQMTTKDGIKTTGSFV